MNGNAYEKQMIASPIITTTNYTEAPTTTKTTPTMPTMTTTTPYRDGDPSRQARIATEPIRHQYHDCAQSSECRIATGLVWCRNYSD